MLCTIPEGTRFNRYSVGPAENTNSTRPSVKVILILDKYRMPRATPDTALIINPIPNTPIMTIRILFPIGPMSDNGDTLTDLYRRHPKRRGCAEQGGDNGKNIDEFSSEPFSLGFSEQRVKD